MIEKIQTHIEHNDRPLHESGQELSKPITRSWGFGVQLESVNTAREARVRWDAPASTEN